MPDMQAAFANIFGQGMWTIAGSVTAFLIGQLIDVAVFHRIRQITGERWIWLRATGSTAVSQLIDSFIVLYIAFVLGPQQWPVPLFLAVGTVNYGYKLLMAFLLIPLIYLTRRGIRAYLGVHAAERLQGCSARVCDIRCMADVVIVGAGAAVSPPGASSCDEACASRARSPRARRRSSVDRVIGVWVSGRHGMFVAALREPESLDDLRARARFHGA